MPFATGSRDVPSFSRDVPGLFAALSIYLDRLLFLALGHIPDNDFHAPVALAALLGLIIADGVVFTESSYDDA
jgi:hypothetical protein